MSSNARATRKIPTIAHFLAVEHIVTQMALDAVHPNYKSLFYTQELGYLEPSSNCSPT
jgi:hypothetical protein